MPKKNDKKKITTTHKDKAQFSKNELSIELEETKRQLSDMTEMCKRAMADLENYKKFVEQQHKKAAWYGISEVIKDLLPVLDTFSRAQSFIEQLPKEHQEGFSGLYRQFQNILKKHNVKPIKAMGKTFDPVFHEAFMEGDGPKNTIIEVFEEGYTINGEILRPAKVRVGNGK